MQWVTSKGSFQLYCSMHRISPNTVYKSIKRVLQWAAYYYTHEKSYFPVISQATPLDALPRMTHLKPARKFNDREREVMLEWAANNGKAVRQRTVRQETTASKHVRHFCPINGKDNSYLQIVQISSEHAHFENFRPPNLKRVLSTENSYS